MNTSSAVATLFSPQIPLRPGPTQMLAFVGVECGGMPPQRRGGFLIAIEDAVC